MSQHTVLGPNRKYVFGWDQPLQSFYLQVHDLTLPEDERIIIWLGADPKTIMYEVDDLVQVAYKNDLIISDDRQAVLYLDKDEGR